MGRQLQDNTKIWTQQKVLHPTDEGELLWDHDVFQTIECMKQKKKKKVWKRDESA